MSRSTRNSRLLLRVGSRLLGRRSRRCHGASRTGRLDAVQFGNLVEICFAFSVIRPCPEFRRNRYRSDPYILHR